MNLRGRPVLFTAIGLVAVGALYLTFSILDPTPPRTIVMSTGPEGSPYALYAEQYRDYLAANGISLELRASGGAAENLSRLTDESDGTEVAFITMGSPRLATEQGLYSLGAMFFEPLWVFTTDDEIAARELASASEKRISIGLPGSRSNVAARRLFMLLGFGPADIPFLELDARAATSQMEEGEVDAVIMVTEASSPLVKSLLGNGDIELVSFLLADAFVALYPQLKKLVVPAGAGSISKVLPPNDVNILASTAILAIRKDLHPAIQMLLLDAATEIHGTPDMFHADGRFPSVTVSHLPLSPDAARYYTSGRPFLQRFLPFWLAILVMQLLVAALPLLGLVYPALKFMPSAFDWAMRRRVYLLYGELRVLESELPANFDEGSAKEYVEKLDKLESRVRNLKVPITFSNLVFALRSHINVVRQRIPKDTTT